MNLYEHKKGSFHAGWGKPIPAQGTKKPSLLRLKAITAKGGKVYYDVDPEVGFHILQEVKNGATSIHFEDAQERPVTLCSSNIKAINLVKRK